MRELLRFINRHIADPSLSAAQAAAELGITARRIHQVFAAGATTFNTYVAETRVRHAALDLRLAPNGQPIFEIACRWGFYDKANFRKAFKRVFGISPREYRAMFQQMGG